MNTKAKKLAPAQLEILVSFMELHPPLASAQVKKSDAILEQRRNLWETLTQELNSIEGCPRKTLERWKKTWMDQKTKTQTKAVKLIQNNGESTKLTRVEERILKIIASCSKVNPTEQTNEKIELSDGIVTLPFMSHNFTVDSVISDSSSISMIDTPSNTTESFMEITPSSISMIDTPSNTTESYMEITPDTVAIPKPEIILPEIPQLTSTSSDIPILIKQEPPDTIEDVAEATPASQSIPSVTTTDSLNKFPTSTSNKSPVKIRKRKHYRANNKYITAERAAESFVNIAERNCSVLERIAKAMETQAAEATKQTQLMQELIDVLKNKT